MPCHLGYMSITSTWCTPVTSEFIPGRILTTRVSESCELTDENSADEEGDVPIGQHNLNPNHLLAQAEIDLSSDDEIIQQPPCKK